MVLGSKSRRGFTRAARRGTQGFSSEKFAKVHHGNLQSRTHFARRRIRRQRIQPQELRGAEILVKACRPRASSTSGAIPAARCCYIYDALYKQDTIQHVLVRHEQAAVHAADGYARATGEVGVALVTSGPGVTNAVTGIATAYMDSIPMVIITGQVPTPAIGLDAFQECDTVGITRPDRQAQLPGQGRARPGDDDEEGVPHRPHRPARPGGGRHPEGRVAATTAPFQLPGQASRCARTTRCARATAARSARRVQLLLAAKRPYIYTGGGVVLGNASAELRALVDLLGYPVHQHADGPGRLSRPATEVPRHAGHARHLRGQHDDAELRRAAGRRRALRRPRDRQPEALRVRSSARSSTSTSTRRRSPSASRSTSRSSATSRTCCRS